MVSFFQLSEVINVGEEFEGTPVKLEELMLLPTKMEAKTWLRQMEINTRRGDSTRKLLQKNLNKVFCFTFFTWNNQF